MNLNKYHSSGRLYTPKEARDRAAALWNYNYVARGYVGRNITGADGKPIPERKVKPYSNEAKRQERSRRDARLRVGKS